MRRSWPAGGERIDRYSSFLSFGLIAFATVLFLVPAVPGWSGDPDRDSLAKVSAAISVALLVVYVAVTWYSLRRHSVRHVSSDDEIEGWSLRAALGALAAATVVTALVAEILVGSLEVFSEKVGLSDFFVAAVIVAIVGNAAEHGGAVVVAHRGKIALAAEIALASAAQVAVFLIPAVALLSWLIDPLVPQLPPGRDRRTRGLRRLRGARALRRPVEPEARNVPPSRVRGRRRRVLRRGRALETRSDVVKTFGICASDGVRAGMRDA